MRTHLEKTVPNRDFYIFCDCCWKRSLTFRDVVFQLDFLHPNYVQISRIFKPTVVCHKCSISLSFNRDNFGIGILFSGLPSLSFITV